MKWNNPWLSVAVHHGSEQPLAVCCGSPRFRTFRLNVSQFCFPVPSSNSKVAVTYAPQLQLQCSRETYQH